MPKGYTMADSSINDQLIKIGLVESHGGAGKTFLRGPSGKKIFDFSFLKCCILVYFIFLSNGGTRKRRGAQSSLSSPYPTFSTNLIKMHSTHSWIKCVLSSSISYFVVCYFSVKYLISQNYDITWHFLTN